MARKRAQVRYACVIKALQIFSKERDQMTDLGAVLAQLKHERDKLNRAIEALSGIGGKSPEGGRRKLSAAAREKIAAAQRKRWAKVKRKKA